MILEVFVALTGIIVFTIVLIAGYLTLSASEEGDDGNRR